MIFRVGLLIAWGSLGAVRVILRGIYFGLVRVACAWVRNAEDRAERGAGGESARRYKGLTATKHSPITFEDELIKYEWRRLTVATVSTDASPPLPELTVTLGGLSLIGRVEGCSVYATMRILIILKESAEIGAVLGAKHEYSILRTSNFCMPNFPGMWADVDWHRQVTVVIRKGQKGPGA